MARHLPMQAFCGEKVTDYSVESAVSSESVQSALATKTTFLVAAEGTGRVELVVGCSPRRRRRSFLSLLAAFLQPALERLLALAGRFAKHQALDADVFVQVRPVDAFAAPNQPPVVPFLRRAVLQARKPRERRSHVTPVGKFDTQRFAGHAHVFCERRPWFNCQSIHAILGTVLHGSRQSAAESD